MRQLQQKYLIMFTFVFFLFSVCSYAQSIDEEELEDWRKFTARYGAPPESLINPPCESEEPFFGLPPRPYMQEKKGCYTNQRWLIGAIEMYNMNRLNDHTDGTNRIIVNVEIRKPISENWVISELLKEDYIKSPPVLYEKCVLKAYGDLLHDNAILYCDYHGCAESHRYRAKEKKLGRDGGDGSLFDLSLILIALVSFLFVVISLVCVVTLRLYRWFRKRPRARNRQRDVSDC